MLSRKGYFTIAIFAACIGLLWIGCPLFLKYTEMENLENYGPYKYLVQTDKDDAWTKLMFVKEKCDSVQFNAALKEVLGLENMNESSIIAATRYIQFNNRIDFLPQLKRKYCQLINVPVDSCMMAIIKENEQYKKTNGGPAVTYDLREAICQFEE
jgi:hypothetical protein